VLVGGVDYLPGTAIKSGVPVTESAAATATNVMHSCPQLAVRLGHLHLPASSGLAELFSASSDVDEGRALKWPSQSDWQAGAAEKEERNGQGLRWRTHAITGPAHAIASDTEGSQHRDMAAAAGRRESRHC